MRLHVVGLPHTDVTRAFDWCAYTAKVRRLPAMLAAFGHEVVLYASAEVDPATRAACAEVVPVVSGGGDRDRWFGGPWDPARVFDRWEPDDPCWTEMNAAAIADLGARLRPGDALGLIAGRCQEAIADAFPGHLALEWGVGYEGVLERSHRAYESHAWQAYVAGRRNENDGRLFDAVIPNAYDPLDFCERPPGDYLLFLGRHTARKGTEIVREVGRRHRVITAGQGGPIEGCEYFGVVTGADKAELLARARAVLVPTLYVEPFGGVAVEAQLSGVPVIATDFGAFPETCPAGYRCATLAEFLAAADECAGPQHPRARATTAARARARYSLEAVAPRYDRWLRRCDTLHRDGWYEGTRSAATP